MARKATARVSTFPHHLYCGEKGDRKGPHLSTSSAPASTMMTRQLPRLFLVEARMGRNLCGCLPASGSTQWRAAQAPSLIILSSAAPTLDDLIVPVRMAGVEMHGLAPYHARAGTSPRPYPIRTPARTSPTLLAKQAYTVVG
jgi:hypothetical protein